MTAHPKIALHALRGSHGAVGDPRTGNPGETRGAGLDGSRMKQLPAGRVSLLRVVWLIAAGLASWVLVLGVPLLVAELLS